MQPLVPSVLGTSWDPPGGHGRGAGWTAAASVIWTSLQKWTDGWQDGWRNSP